MLFYFFEIPYEKLGEIEKLLKDYEAEVIDKSFLEKIVFKVRINEEFLTNLENYPYINLILYQYLARSPLLIEVGDELLLFCYKYI